MVTIDCHHPGSRYYRERRKGEKSYQNIPAHFIRKLCSTERWRNGILSSELVREIGVNVT
jgi:hypothetical protein